MWKDNLTPEVYRLFLCSIVISISYLAIDLVWDIVFVRLRQFDFLLEIRSYIELFITLRRLNGFYESDEQHRRTSIVSVRRGYLNVFCRFLLQFFYGYPNILASDVFTTLLDRTVDLKVASNEFADRIFEYLKGRELNLQNTGRLEISRRRREATDIQIEKEKRRVAAQQNEESAEEGEQRSAKHEESGISISAEDTYVGLDLRSYSGLLTHYEARSLDRKLRSGAACSSRYFMNQREFRVGILSLFHNRDSILEKLYNFQSLDSTTKYAVWGVFWCLQTLVCLLLFQIDFWSIIVPFLSAFLGFAFIFGDLLSSLFNGLTFVMFSKVYEPGDNIITDQQFLKVRSVQPLYTTFVTLTGQLLSIPNAEMRNKSIVNWSKSNVIVIRPSIQVAANTTNNQLFELGLRVRDFVLTNPDLFESSFMFKVSDFNPKENAITLIISLCLNRRFRYEFSDWLDVRTDVLLFLSSNMQDVGIRWAHAVDLNVTNDVIGVGLLDSSPDFSRAGEQYSSSIEQQKSQFGDDSDSGDEDGDNNESNEDDSKSDHKDLSVPKLDSPRPKRSQTRLDYRMPDTIPKDAKMEVPSIFRSILRQRYSAPSTQTQTSTQEQTTALPTSSSLRRRNRKRSIMPDRAADVMSFYGLDRSAILGSTLLSSIKKEIHPPKKKEQQMDLNNVVTNVSIAQRQQQQHEIEQKVAEVEKSEREHDENDEDEEESSSLHSSSSEEEIV